MTSRLAKGQHGLIGRLGRFWEKVRGKTSSPPPVFIHIPKTGGTYIRQYETDRVPVISPIENLGHTTIIEEKLSRVYPPSVGFLPNYITARERIRSRFVFCVVRNIFSWLVSYAGHAGGWNPKYHHPDHYDYGNASKGFDYLVRTIADRDGDIWPCRKLIHFQMFSDGGSLVPDYLARNETLDDDLYDLSLDLGLFYCKKPRQRTGRHKDYRSYYADSLIDVVYKTWGREIELFGYTFDGMDVSEALLKRRIDKQTKARIQYFWETDKLLIDGKELCPSSC